MQIMFISKSSETVQMCWWCTFRNKTCSGENMSLCKAGWVGYFTAEEDNIEDAEFTEIVEDLEVTCSIKLELPESKDPMDTQVGGGHYKSFAIQPVEFCQKNKLGYCEGNIVKYACRHGAKNGAEDVRKIIHYAQLILKLNYGVDE